MNILVTDGENRSALAVTRSLGRRGHTIFVTGRKSGNLSASSKFCRKSFQTPDPMLDRKGFAYLITEIAFKEGINIIIPITEQSIYCLNDVRELLEKHSILACAPVDKMAAVSDKYKLFQLAEELGVPIPRTTYIDGPHDFQNKIPEIQEFPVVVKPSLSRIADGERIISTGVMYANCHDELSHLYSTKPALRYPSMIQELITGEGTGLFTLFDISCHLALFSHRRILEKPPSGGVSVMSQSVPLDYEMVENARRLLAKVEWQGVAMVEFKRDKRDGKAKLMEINGRFWGSLKLAIASGVDFPALCLDYFNGKKPACVRSDYLIGQRLKWHLGMLDHILIRIKKGDRKLNLTPGTPGIWRVMSELIHLNGGSTTSDVLDTKDILPFLTELKFYIKELLGSYQ